MSSTQVSTAAAVAAVFPSGTAQAVPGHIPVPVTGFVPPGAAESDLVVRPGLPLQSPAGSRRIVATPRAWRKEAPR